MESPQPADEALVREFEEVLSRHGYGFQHAVIGEIHGLRVHGHGWLFEVSEFPVHVQGEGTRIDFILKYCESRFYILAECKRVNPAFGNWLFTRAPRSSLSRTVEMKTARLQELQFDTSAKKVFLRSVDGTTLTEKLYHGGVPVRSPGVKGDKDGSPDRDAIEKTATQVCRGLNGFIEWTCARPEWLAPNTPVRLMPVIFTTANLFVTQADLSLVSDVKTGKVDLSGGGTVRESWVFYQYDQSPGLIARSGMHEIDKRRDPLDLSRAKLAEYTRTVAIVNVAGILDFLLEVGPQWHF